MPAGEMDAEYSVGINNRFIGIDSDMIDDPLELIRAAQEKPKKEKEVKTKGKKDVKPTKGIKEKKIKVDAPLPVELGDPGKKSEASDRTRGRGRGRGRGGDRGRGRGRGGGFGSVNSPRDENVGGFGDNSGSSGGGQRSGPRGACHRCGEEGHFIRNCPQAASPAGGAPPEGFGMPSNSGFGAPSNSGFGAPSNSGFGSTSGFGGSSDNDEERSGGRGGFRGGRGRGGRGRGNRGGREFDRRSGSDKSSVKAFEKRDGSGAYNWGTPQDELEASEDQQGGFGAPKDVDETQNENAEETQEVGTASAEEGESKEDVEAPQLSFDEYKQQQAQTRSKPQHNIRKANEGEKLKGLKQLKKPTEEENEADGSLFFPKKYVEEKWKTSGRVKEQLPLSFKYASGDNRHMDSRGNRGQRGDRGRGRGRRDNAFGSETKYQLENNEEFPSLA